MRPKTKIPMDALNDSAVSSDREIIGSMDRHDPWLEGTARAVIEHALAHDGYRRAIVLRESARAPVPGIAQAIIEGSINPRATHHERPRGGDAHAITEVELRVRRTGAGECRHALDSTSAGPLADTEGKNVEALAIVFRREDGTESEVETNVAVFADADEAVEDATIVMPADAGPDTETLGALLHRGLATRYRDGNAERTEGLDEAHRHACTLAAIRATSCNALDADTRVLHAVAMRYLPGACVRHGSRHTIIIEDDTVEVHIQRGDQICIERTDRTTPAKLPQSA